jgi:hypothetical protein
MDLMQKPKRFGKDAEYASDARAEQMCCSNRHRGEDSKKAG